MRRPFLSVGRAPARRICLPEATNRHVVAYLCPRGCSHGPTPARSASASFATRVLEHERRRNFRGDVRRFGGCRARKLRLTMSVEPSGVTSNTTTPPQSRRRRKWSLVLVASPPLFEQQKPGPGRCGWRRCEVAGVDRVAGLAMISDTVGTSERSRCPASIRHPFRASGPAPLTVGGGAGSPEQLSSNPGSTGPTAVP
jgi:hypothetical protein